jgi:hypothetical protein
VPKRPKKGGYWRKDQSQKVFLVTALKQK